jgi:hypothetical protein
VGWDYSRGTKIRGFFRIVKRIFTKNINRGQFF